MYLSEVLALNTNVTFKSKISRLFKDAFSNLNLACFFTFSSLVSFYLLIVEKRLLTCSGLGDVEKKVLKYSRNLYIL